MAEPPPPPPLPQPRPPLPRPRPPLSLPQPLPLLHLNQSVPPPIKFPGDCSLMEELPAATPQPLPPLSQLQPLPHVPPCLSSTASSALTSPPDHVSLNPRVGDFGEVESAGTAEAPSVDAFEEPSLLKISKPDEEDGLADESTSLAALCARMIQSCTYTVEVKICGGGTEICGDSTISWQIVEGTSTSMKDLLACIAGTFPLFSEQNIILEDKRKKKSSTKALPACPNENEAAVPVLLCSSDAIEDNVAKLTSSKTISKSTSMAISIAPDSPAMGTRSKKTVASDSPAMSTRSKKRVVPKSQAMATRSKKKLKL